MKMTYERVYGSYLFVVCNDPDGYLVQITDMRECAGGTGYPEKTPREAMFNTIRHLGDMFSPRVCDRIKDAGKKVFPV